MGLEVRRLVDLLSSKQFEANVLLEVRTHAVIKLRYETKHDSPDRASFSQTKSSGRR